jgi:hypothetical protein
MGAGPVKAIALLSRYREEGHEARDVIDHSLANGWAGLFPPKGQARTTERDNPWWLKDMLNGTK